MIFKNYKVLIDNTLNPIGDKSLRGHKRVCQTDEVLWKSTIFRELSFYPYLFVHYGGLADQGSADFSGSADLCNVGIKIDA